MVIKAVIFDGDGTLFHGLKKEAKIKSLLAKKRLHFSETEIKPAYELSVKIRDKLIRKKLLKLGDHAYLVENQIRLILLGIESRKAKKLAQYLCSNWTKASEKKAFEDAEPALKWLKSNHIKIGLLTAGASSGYLKTLKENHFSKYFDAVIGEDITNAPKPAKIAYQTALNKLKIQPKEAIMVGDHPENDYIAPRKFGMHAILIDRNHLLSKKYKRIQSLNQLPKIIKKLNKKLEELDATKN